jgi:hypothetical protein
MKGQLIVSGVLAGVGVGSALLAVVSERRMQRHRQPGVSYGAVTFRRDGRWRRGDLFTPEGLRHQRRASRFGVAVAGLWVLALVVWAVLGV